MTVRTDGLATESAQHHSVLYLVLVLFHHAEELIDAHPFVWVEVFLGGQSVPKPVFLLLRQFVVRLEDREVERFSTAYELLEPHAHLLASPADHASVVKTQRGIRDDQLLVDADDASESFAGRTSAKRRVEGKHVVRWLLEGDAVSLETSGEVVGDMAREEEKAASTIALIEGGLGRIHQSADVVLLIAYRRAVDDEEDGLIVLSHQFLQLLAARLQKLLIADA